jgi:hypothetical protein
VIDTKALAKALAELEAEFTGFAQAYTPDVFKDLRDEHRSFGSCSAPFSYGVGSFPQIFLPPFRERELSQHALLQSIAPREAIVAKFWIVRDIIASHPAFGYPDLAVEVGFAARAGSTPRLNLQIEHRNIGDRKPTTISTLMKRMDRMNKALAGYDASGNYGTYEIKSERFIAHSPLGVLLKYAFHKAPALLDPKKKAPIPEVGYIYSSEEMLKLLNEHRSAAPA